MFHKDRRVHSSKRHDNSNPSSPKYMKQNPREHKGECSPPTPSPLPPSPSLLFPSPLPLPLSLFPSVHSLLPLQICLYLSHIKKYSGFNKGINIDIYGTFHPTTAEYTCFSSAIPTIYKEINTNTSKFKTIKIRWSKPFDHN